MNRIIVHLSHELLADFLDNNDGYMESYRAELQKRLSDQGDSTIVEIDHNIYSDVIIINNKRDTSGYVLGVMAEMASDWGWLLSK